MNDFDVSLIREFEKRPGFYDRDSPHFKNKLHNAQAWQEISNILGYDVALLKDRMLQLRNRYNLEKRRVENLSLQRSYRSPWPLYNHLNFLSSHIRSRRPLKLKMAGTSSEISNSESNKPSDLNMNPHGELTIKIENGTDESDSVEEQMQRSTRNRNNGRMNSTRIPSKVGKKLANNSILRHAVGNKNVSVKTVEFSKVFASKSKCNDDIGKEIPDKKRRVETRLQKYEAFGKFISSSLLDMPTDKALLLVEKLTSDLVKVLIEKNHSKNNMNSAVEEQIVMDISDDDIH